MAGGDSLAILYVFAAWALISGIADIAHAFMSGLSGGQRVWLVIIGLLGIAVGIVFFVHPVSGIVALLWVAGIYLIVLGVLRIVAGFTNPPSAGTASGLSRRHRGVTYARGPAGSSSRPALCTSQPASRRLVRTCRHDPALSRLRRSRPRRARRPDAP